MTGGSCRAIDKWAMPLCVQSANQIYTLQATVRLTVFSNALLSRSLLYFTTVPLVSAVLTVFKMSKCMEVCFMYCIYLGRSSYAVFINRP